MFNKVKSQEVQNLAYHHDWNSYLFNQAMNASIHVDLFPCCLQVPCKHHIPSRVVQRSFENCGLTVIIVEHSQRILENLHQTNMLQNMRKTLL